MEWNKTILIVVMLLMTAPVQAQLFGEWFRQKKTQIDYYVNQIAALKAYNDLLVEGYEMVRDGLQIAHDLRKGEFDLHDRYFQSLRSINPSLKKQEADQLYQRILDECQVLTQLHERLTPEKGVYVFATIDALKRKARECYAHYLLLTAVNEYALTDDGRMRRIDETTGELRRQYAFAKRLHAVLQKILVQGDRETADTKTLDKIFDR